MKKLFVIALATAALASCSKVEPIEPGYKSAIGFSKSFVDNTTKALITTANIEDFSVWGTENGASIFNGVEVRKDDDSQGSTWGYTSTRYWHENSDYSFAAIAPSAHGLSSLVLDNELPEYATYTLVDGIGSQVDLLYATASVQDVEENHTAPVAFTFAHQLAKVQFAITNGYPANYTVEISNLKIKASESAKVTFPGTWTEHADLDDFKLSFTITDPIATGTNGVSTQNLIIPKAAWVDADDIFYTIEGTATVKLNGTEVKTINIAYELKDELLAGFHYDIKATITSNAPIVFSATVKDTWEDGSDPTFNQY